MILGRVEVRGEDFRQLFLQSCQVCGGAIRPGLVPQGDKALVEWPEKVDEMYKPIEVLCLGIGRIVILRRKGDGRLQRERSMSLEGVGSVPKC